MPSLQLLQLTEHGRNLFGSKRRTLAVATCVLVAGGTAAYMHSRLLTRAKKPRSSRPSVDKEIPNNTDEENTSLRTTKLKKWGLRSLKVLATILISQMGLMGARNLLSLVGIVVLRTGLSNRLAKVQGFLFRAAFLRRVPSFLRLIIENLLLCFLQSTLVCTSKYITGRLSLRFRKNLTELIHVHYFEVIELLNVYHRPLMLQFFGITMFSFNFYVSLLVILIYVFGCVSAA